jgi:putative FmdB family regulatory protein
MPTYLYLCETHKEFEAIHSIKDVLELCPICKENNIETPVKRLIAATNFQLVGNGWAKDSFSK